MSRIVAAVVAVAVFVAVAAIVPGAGSYAMFEDVESVTVGFSTDVSTGQLDVVELEKMTQNASPSEMVQPAAPVSNHSSEDTTNGSLPVATPGAGAVDLPRENGTGEQPANRTVDELENGTVDHPPANAPANGSAPGADGEDDKPPVGVSPPETPPDADESSAKPNESAPDTPPNGKSDETPGSDSGDGDPTTGPATPVDSAGTPDDTESEGADVGVDEPAPPDGTSESSGQDQAGDNGHPETDDDENSQPAKPSGTGGDSHSEASPADETAADDTDTSSSSRGLGSGDPSSGDSIVRT